uniref:Cab3 promoter-binding protein n=1 Tax=Arabidopsis thaliana TaxID=3702 RepID=Q39063_ARATH|nr:cab3 promoter-binding protein [Arabidopsis thaliana]
MAEAGVGVIEPRFRLRLNRLYPSSTSSSTLGPELGRTISSHRNLNQFLLSTVPVQRRSTLNWKCLTSQQQQQQLQQLVEAGSLVQTRSRKRCRTTKKVLRDAFKVILLQRIDLIYFFIILRMVLAPPVPRRQPNTTTLNPRICLSSYKIKSSSVSLYTIYT